jgi:CheY-like chemotaxis protein
MLINQLRVLVAEPYEAHRNFWIGTLQCFGAIAVHQAADNHQALGVLRDSAKPVDMVISDLALPGEEDRAWIRQLGQRGAAMPIIFAGAFDRKLLGFIAEMAEANHIRVLRLADTPEGMADSPSAREGPQVPANPVVPGARRTQPAAWQKHDRGPDIGTSADA